VSNAARIIWVGVGGGEWGVGDGDRKIETPLANADSASTSTPYPYTHPPRSYCAGTYVGSCVAESITDAYAVTRPVPLSTFTVTRAL
jgi:hypothetical protein